MPSKSNIKKNINKNINKNIKHKKPHLLYLTLLFFIVCVILFTNSNSNSNVHSKSNYENIQHFNNTSTNTSNNNITITLELVKVDTPELREHGLMFRKIPLSESTIQESSSSTHSDTQSTKSVNNSRKHITKQGMLFDYKKTDIISLWMHNTYIPLDMIFLDEYYNIVSFKRNAEPHSTTHISSTKPSRYAIELNGNSIDALELQIGHNIKDYIKIISKLN